MLWIPQWLRERLRAVLERWGRPRIVHAPDLVPDLPPTTVEVSPNRATRRQLERRRRRHDKFVTPKGERLPPPAKPKAPPLKKPARVEVVNPDIEDATVYIKGKHHEDTQEVLYAETEMYGEFNFRDTILQQLERYFVYLARMRKHDNSAFQFYRQYGATLLPYIKTGSYDRGGSKSTAHEPPPPLSDWFHQTRPAFGCFVYGADPATEQYEARTKPKRGYKLFVPKFMYFTKFKKPPANLQPIDGGDIYTMTIWWDRPFDPKYKSKYGVPEEFGIWVSADGKQLVALRSLDTEMIPIWSRRRHEFFHIPQRAWRIPGDFEQWAKREGVDVQTFLTGIFLDATEQHTLTQLSMVRVAVTKDDMTATFSVNVHKMAYFFQDRDIRIADDGARRRIFHIVRAHTRKNGAEVKFHFRGEREFNWAGYQVRITVPGRDHHNWADFDVGAEEYDGRRDKRYLDMEHLAAEITKDMRRQT